MKQNLTLVALSVIATLLVVLVMQNFTQPQPLLLSQLGGGGGSSVGTIGVATGPITGAGDANALWIYDPQTKRLMVYFLNNKNQLELRASRWVEYDLQLQDFAMKQGGKYPSVKEIKGIVSKGGGDADKAE